MMPLKLPAAIAKLLETGGQSKPQTGLPQQPIQVSTPFCRSLETLPSAPVGSSLWRGAAGREAGFCTSLGAAGQRGRP